MMNSQKLIREVWTECGVDAEVPYSRQDPDLMDEVRDEVRTHSGIMLSYSFNGATQAEPMMNEQVILRLPSIAEKYEDAWPIEAFIQLAF